MSRKKRKPNRAERKKRQEERSQSQFEDVVEGTAATFTCSYEIARDFAWQCSDGAEEMESDILFNQLAHEIWRAHGKNEKELAQALADFLAERERHRNALLTLETRFKTLTDTEIHEHLDPIEKYQELIRERLSSLTPQAVDDDEAADRLSDFNEI
jgi:hypothetical protein